MSLRRFKIELKEIIYFIVMLFVIGVIFGWMIGELHGTRIYNEHKRSLENTLRFDP